MPGRPSGGMGRSGAGLGGDWTTRGRGDVGRIRSIKPEFFLDEDLARLEPLDRLAFIGLWTAADKDGRLEDRPTRLSVQILPYDRGDFDARLSRLADARFVLRYKDLGGRPLIQIRTWERHQRPHHTESASEFEAPSGDDLRSLTVSSPLEHGEGTGSERWGKERKGKERKGKNILTSLGEFARFWDGYPRRTAKGAAESAWSRLGDGDREKVLEALPRFAEEWAGRPKGDLRFCPHPATWINQRRWEDDPGAVAAVLWPVPGPARHSLHLGRPVALAGAHAAPGRPQRPVDDEAPEWARYVDRALRADSRPAVPDELAAALSRWQDGEETGEPEGWREALRNAYAEAEAYARRA